MNTTNILDSDYFHDSKECRYGEPGSQQCCFLGNSADYTFIN